MIQRIFLRGTEERELDGRLRSLSPALIVS